MLWARWRGDHGFMVNTLFRRNSGKRKADACSGRDRIIDPNRAAMCFDDRTADRQAKSCPTRAITADAAPVAVYLDRSGRRYVRACQARYLALGHAR